MAAAKQTPSFLAWKTSVVTKDWNNTTFGIDASNGSVTHKETDSD